MLAKSPLLLAVVAAGCSSTQPTSIEAGAPSADAAAADAMVTAPAELGAGCRKQWTKKRYGSTDDPRSTVKAAGGRLNLNVTVGFESVDVTAVSTRKLSGDFAVTVQVDDFQHQDPFTYLLIGVGDGSEGAAQFGGTEAGTGWRGIGWPSPQSTTSATTATFRFQRFGNTLNIRAEVAEKLATRNVVFTTEPVEVRMILRASMGIPSASAIISEVVVNGGGGDLVTDSFDCDSVE